MGKINLKAALLDLLFPPKCAFCGALMEHTGSGVCPRCSSVLPFIPDNKVLREVNGFPAAVTFYYDEPVSTGIKALKFRKTPWRTKIFARYLAQTAAEHLGGQFDEVTFVPVSIRRNYERGFDQARLLADETAKLWNTRAVPTVKKSRDNRRQSSLDSPEERQKNVQGVYRVPHPERAAGKRFLLIDDVLTTGSTISACAAALMEAGAVSVVCAALAGGHGPQKDAQIREFDASDKDRGVN